MAAQPHQEGLFMRAFPRSFAAYLAAVAAGPAIAASAPELHDVSLRLFEQADEVVLPVSRRVYSTRFDATRMRMLGVEITANYADPEATTQVLVACTLQRPDGSLAPSDREMSIPLFDGYVASNSANLLWGVALEEDWVPGVYKVECRVDDRLIGQSQFEVMLNPSDVANAEIRVASLQLFPVETDLPARTERRYTSKLTAATTRRIGIELEFTHQPLGRALTVPVDCYYFWPDGQTSPPVVLSYEPQPSWPGGYSAGALGWEEPGNWSAGVYTVTCSIYGRPVVVDRFLME